MHVATQLRPVGRHNVPTFTQGPFPQSPRSSRHPDSPQDEQPPPAVEETEGPTPSRTMQAILDAFEEPMNKQR